LRKLRVDAGHIAPDNVRHFAGIHPSLNQSAIQPALALHVETVCAARDWPVVVDEATAGITIEERTDGAWTIPQLLDASCDLKLNRSRQSSQPVRHQLPLGPSQPRHLRQLPAA